MNRRIDASSKEAFENSLSIFEKEARQKDFEKFKEAYQSLTMEVAIKKSYFWGKVDVDSELNSLFDGKTPNEIIRDFKKEN